MAQIAPPVVFTSGQVLTASALNAHVSSASLLPGAVTDQTNLTANTVAVGDSVIIHDLSDLALKEATVGDLLNSGISITTGAIAGVTGANLVITPAATFALSVAGNLSTTANFSVTGTSTLTGNVAASGTLTVTGNAVFNSNSNFNGNVTVSGTSSFTGPANFTGGFQIGGSTGYMLYEVYEQNLSPWTATAAGVFSAVVTTAAFTKPVDEIWVFEIDGVWTMVRGYGAGYAFRYSTEAYRTGAYLKYDVDYSSGLTLPTSRSIYYTWTVLNGTALSSRSIMVDVWANSGSQLSMFVNGSLASEIITTGTLPLSKFRISKYKTI